MVERRRSEVQLQQHRNVKNCSVVVYYRGREMVYHCPDYDTAVKWVLMESKSYGIPASFPDRWTTK